MPLLAHIGKVPVEEWLPFVVPVVALFIYGRRRDRRRKLAVGRLPEPSEPLGESTLEAVEASWAQANHTEITRSHLPILYPPGPDGMNAAELAERCRADAGVVERMLEELADLDYLELDEREGFEGQRAWLTFKGYELVDNTENALIAALAVNANSE